MPDDHDQLFNAMVNSISHVFSLTSSLNEFVPPQIIDGEKKVEAATTEYPYKPQYQTSLPDQGQTEKQYSYH